MRAGWSWPIALVRALVTMLLAFHASRAQTAAQGVREAGPVVRTAAAGFGRTRSDAHHIWGVAGIYRAILQSVRPAPQYRPVLGVRR